MYKDMYYMCIYYTEREFINHVYILYEELSQKYKLRFCQMHKLQVRTVTGLHLFHITDYNIICLLKKNYYCNFESEYTSELNINR